MTCHCFIRHATSPDEREAAAKRLKYSRSVGDTNGIIIAIAALSGDCPGREKNKEEKKNAKI
ncbi:MAG TPA: hypothetical protein EYF95_04180 [Flavobacteriales bacterium]|nr:hypothetical protein [Flavobacteriales bacterium]